MNGPQEALPLTAVLQVAAERRRRRERVRTAAAPAAGLLAAGVASALVVAIQLGDATDPAPPLVAAAPPSSTAPPTTTASAPPFAPVVLQREYIESLALGADQACTGCPPLADADELSRVWSVPLAPEARAIVAKASLVGESLDVSDPDGGAELVDRFARAGYTERDAATLAEAWATDARSAAMLGALVADAG